MKYERYDQETAYQVGEIAAALTIVNTTLAAISSKLSELLSIERDMLVMQSEMFDDYKRVKEQAHVKLQGDTEGNHAAAHTA